MTTSEWRAVERWRGLYSVSDDGQVRSNRSGKTLKPGTNSKGYRIVTVTFDGLRVGASLHVLVAEAFIGPRPDGTHVCHADGDKDNNAVENLRYDSPTNNELDKLAQGRNPNRNKTQCPQGHAYDEANTLWTRGGRERRCRTCAHARVTAARAAKRALTARARAA